MEEYLHLLKKAMNGERTLNPRTQIYTIGVKNQEGRFDLESNFPILTTKPIYWKGVAEEALWFLRGETNIRPLLEKKVKIWSSDGLRFNLDKIQNEYKMFEPGEIEEAQKAAGKAKEVLSDTSIPTIYRKEMHDNLMQKANNIIKIYEKRILDDEEFANECGDLGPVYGAQWRGTNGATNIDQIAALEDNLATGVDNRRMIVNAWNPVDLKKMALPPCHYCWQVGLNPESKKLDLTWKQRSCDTVLGVPFNIASYALIASLLAETHGFKRGELVGDFSDLHVYEPHLAAAEEQLERDTLTLPKLIVKNKRSSVTEYEFDDFELVGYKKHPRLENPTPMYGGFF